MKNSFNSSLLKTALAACLTLTFFSCNFSTDTSENSSNSDKSNQKVINQTFTLEKAESKEGNPLKGLFVFGNTDNFPVSMEYFSLPVSAVQTGMKEFNWEAFEKELKEVAEHGNQAVVRFYYDTPGEKSGVPEFITKQLGEDFMIEYPKATFDVTGGFSPDYTNKTFRQSIINFIEAFGKEYDGDGRIAFITLGLLGFWGEWHNWPFDDKSQDEYDAKFIIPTEVQKEVLDAYDSAFNITQLCAREPKSGIDFSKYDVGFHDDSFAYSTLSKAKGGSSWHFSQKLIDANVSDCWKRVSIGGEVYPNIQNVIFAEKSDECQDWDLCMEETHASWLICGKVKDYTGSTLEEAKRVSKSMGYDLRVLTLSCGNSSSENALNVKAEIENIGIAPFYYDHRTWPVVIGIKQDGAFIKEHITDWDLCDIESKGKVLFETNIKDLSLKEGNVEICLKVKNPVKNGKILWFANKMQTDDGWLYCGSFRY